mmetsp:Transcript_1729/g.2745  ORF Transcript_1729/g.2745 Transcript_1729/m.2745 type:complete len:267 (-) Transcript_1729:162-962(-)
MDRQHVPRIAAPHGGACPQHAGGGYSRTGHLQPVRREPRPLLPALLCADRTYAGPQPEADRRARAAALCESLRLQPVLLVPDPARAVRLRAAAVQGALHLPRRPGVEHHPEQRGGLRARVAPAQRETGRGRRAARGHARARSSARAVHGARGGAACRPHGARGGAACRRHRPDWPCRAYGARQAPSTQGGEASPKGGAQRWRRRRQGVLRRGRAPQERLARGASRGREGEIVPALREPLAAGRGGGLERQGPRGLPLPSRVQPHGA